MYHIYHFNDHNSGGKHDKQTNAPFFSSAFELYPLVYFIFAFQELQNSIPCPPFTSCYGLPNTHLHDKDDNFKSIKKDIHFLCKIC